MNDEPSSLTAIWTAEESAVIDLLAMGYSQNAAARHTSVPQKTIWDWFNRGKRQDAFRAEVSARAEMFQANLESIHDSQVMMAISLVANALNGEVHRDSGGRLPVALHVALELLRATQWRKDPHRQIGYGGQ